VNLWQKNEIMPQQQLEKYFWSAATRLRGTIDAGDYKQYIFSLQLFKRICDVYDEEFEKALAESDGDMEYADLQLRRQSVIRNFKFVIHN